MENEDAAHRAFQARKVMAGSMVLRVTRFSNAKANSSTGGMRTIRETTVAKEYEKRIETGLQWIMLLTFVMYPTVSSTILSVYSCHQLDFGERWHERDTSIDCTSTSYKVYLVIFIVLTVAIPLGVPLGFLYLLYRNRDELSHSDDVSNAITPQVFARIVREIDSDIPWTETEVPALFRYGLRQQRVLDIR